MKNMNKVKTIIFSLLTLMGVNAGYADTSIYTIPQSIACFTQYGVTAKELSEETAGVSVMQGEVASMISGLRNMGGHQDLITRLSEVAVMLSNYKAKLLNNTVCDKTQFINLMTESIAAGDKFLPLLNDMKNRF